MKDSPACLRDAIKFRIPVRRQLTRARGIAKGYTGVSSYARDVYRPGEPRAQAREVPVRNAPPP